MKKNNLFFHPLFSKFNIYIQVILLVALLSCRGNMICPAYYSTYVHSKESQDAYFSSIWRLDKKYQKEFLALKKEGKQSNILEDSLRHTTKIQVIAKAYSRNEYTTYFDHLALVKPVVAKTIEEVKRTKYGIAKFQPYWVKNIALRTAPSFDVYVKKTFPSKKDLIQKQEPTLEEEEGFDEELNLADALESDKQQDDNLYKEDEIVVQSHKASELFDYVAKEKEEQKVTYLYDYNMNDLFNVEQEYYNNYYAKTLYRLPKQPKVEIHDETLAMDSLATTESSGFKAFIQNLMFWKKDKDESLENKVENEEIETENNELEPVKEE